VRLACHIRPRLGKKGKKGWDVEEVLKASRLLHAFSGKASVASCVASFSVLVDIPCLLCNTNYRWEYNIILYGQYRDNYI